MGASGWDRLQRVFAEAIELAPGERSLYLDAECASDPDLRRRLEGLLSAHERGRSFLEVHGEAETTLGPEADPGPAPAPEGARPSIPGFRVGREIGRGGMGIVYEAERLHPRQSVALKVLKPSFAQPYLRRRFEQEIQLLARLQHPGIAQIYDAGVAPSPSGPVPYFAMELVRGRSLDAVANDPSVGLRRRLELIAEIAAAVEHAHQRTIIHRDLKPSNILVSAEGSPKILDFGVARALDPELQLTTMQTEIGQLVGTLPYMSPEQASGDLAHLDTRSDVYSLGVVAYELISGRPPYNLADKLVPEAIRVIQQEEPSRLSTIDRAFRGDIETIIAKALEKQRERRYASVGEFAADIRRFLQNEPIVARPPSRVYLFRKFAKRHQPLVVGSAVALALLVAGVAVSSALALRLASANDSLTETVGALRDARDEATKQAATANAVNEFYGDHLLLAAAPEQSLGQDVTIREALDSASARVDTDLSEHREAAAYVHRALASVYRRLDMPDPALRHGEASLAAYSEALGADSPETLLAKSNLAALLADRARFDEADALRAEALEGLRRTVGESHGYTLSVLRGHASELMERGDPESAIPLLRAVIEGLTALPDTDQVNLLNSHVKLSQAFALAKRWDESESTLRDAIDTVGAGMPDDHPSKLEALNSLGSTLVGRKKFAEALPITERTAAAAARVLGAEHINALIARQNLAQTISELDRFDDAQREWLEIIPLLRARLPDPHPLLANIIQSYGIALAKHGHDEEAVVRLEEAHRQFVATLGKGHPEARRCAGWLEGVHTRLGNEGAAAQWRALRDG